MALKDNSKKGVASIALLEVGVLEIVFVLIAIVLFFGLLNYFNILSLSRIYPQLFGFLPQQSKSSPKTQVFKPNISHIKLTSVPCPVDRALCQSGKPITITTAKGKKQYFILFTLPRRTRLKAVFDGTAIVSEESGFSTKPHPYISLRNKDDPGTIAYYDFFGIAGPAQAFKTGETIGIIDKTKEGETNFPNIEPLTGGNLLFSLLQESKSFKPDISGDQILLTK